MMARPAVRTEEGMLGSILRRLTLVERRVSKTPAGLPARLGPEGQEVLDWSDALFPGFYWSDTGAAHAPFADRFVGTVYVISGGPLAGRVVQEVRLPTNGGTGRNTWRRTYDGTWGPWRLVGGNGEGTAAMRAATTPRYWDFWQDTDGTQALYVGNKSGGWRQFSGVYAAPTKAWDSSGGSIWARSDSYNVPTVLETNEYLQITPIALGTGYAALGVVNTIRNPTNTTVTVRLMQFLAGTTQNYTFAWQIMQYT